MAKTANLEFDDIAAPDLGKSHSVSWIVASAFTALSIVLAGYGLFYLAKTQGVFTLSGLYIEGGEVVGQKDIRQMLKIDVGGDLLTFDMEVAGERLESHPWVKSVEIRRTLPSGLAITVLERSPVAIMKMDNSEMYLIDADGVILQRIEKAYLPLPIISGIGVRQKSRKPGHVALNQDLADTIEAMGRLEKYRLFGKSKLAGIDASSSTYFKFNFTGSDVEILVPRFGWTDEMERLRTVDYLLNGKEAAVWAIDLRFKDKVIVSYPSVTEEKRG